MLGLGEPVLDRLEHRLHVRERRAQIVARPGDQLAPRVEEPLERRPPCVEGTCELGDLRRAVLGGACGQVAAGELGRAVSPSRSIGRTIDRASSERGTSATRRTRR